MRGRSHKIISMLALVGFFAMSVAAVAFSAKWLVHELDHDRQVTGTLISHQHESQSGAAGASDSEPLSDDEHLLLHASGSVETPPLPVIPAHSPQSSGRVAPALPSFQVLPPTDQERLFRPPRTAALA